MTAVLFVIAARLSTVTGSILVGFIAAVALAPTAARLRSRGPLVGTLMAFFVTVALGSPTDIVIMAIFTVVINLIQGNLITPLVCGRTINLHPAGVAVAGISGMFLVVPFIAIATAVWPSITAAISVEPG